jgi:hypothetical protein
VGEAVRGTLWLTYDGSPVTGPAVALSLCLLPRLYGLGVGDQGAATTNGPGGWQA